MTLKSFGGLVALGLSACVVVNESTPAAKEPHPSMGTPRSAELPKPALAPPTGEGRQETEAPIVRGALSGQRQVLFSVYAIGSDCSSLGYPTLKVGKTPQHGDVTVEQGTALAGFGEGDARKVCNGRTVPATVVYYMSEAGFVGEDSVAFERIGVRGAYGYHVYIIHVR